MLVFINTSVFDGQGMDNKTNINTTLLARSLQNSNLHQINDDFFPHILKIIAIANHTGGKWTVNDSIIK